MYEYKEMKNINTRDEFIRFMDVLIKDARENSKAWEYKSVDEYLESIQSWVQDMDGFYKNHNIELPSNIDWSLLANILYVGKIYE